MHLLVMVMAVICRVPGGAFTSLMVKGPGVHLLVMVIAVIRRGPGGAFTLL